MVAKIVRRYRNTTKVYQSKQFTTSDHNNNNNIDNDNDYLMNNNTTQRNNNDNNNSNSDSGVYGNEQSLRPQSIKNHNDIERNENKLQQQRKKFPTPRSISSSLQTRQIINCDEYAAKVNIWHRPPSSPKKSVSSRGFSHVAIRLYVRTRANIKQRHRNTHTHFVYYSYSFTKQKPKPNKPNSARTHTHPIYICT